MMGRAGRPRYDPYGEAVVLCKSLDQKEAVEETYLRGDTEPVTSKLGADAALRMHVLGSVAGGYCASEESLLQFLAHTFWAQEAQDWLLRDRLQDTLDFLLEHGFVQEMGGKLAATLFGKRTSDLYIDPLSALRLRTALEAPVEQPTPFALLQAVTGCPDLMPLYLRQGDDWVQDRFWNHHEELLVAADGRDLEATLSYAKTAFLLEDWMAEKHLEELEERYAIGPGDLRSRTDNASWILHALRELARAFRPAWQQPVTDLLLRLEHGVREDLLPLIRLRGIGRVRARTLVQAGIPDPVALRGVPLARLATLPGFGPRLAMELLKQVGGEVPGEAPKRKPKAPQAKLDVAADAQAVPAEGSGGPA